MENQAAAPQKSGIVYAYLLITFAIWGGIYVATRFAVGILPSPVVVCLRNILASITLLLMMRGEKFPKIEKRDWLFFTLIAALGYYLTLVFTTRGTALAGASTSALVNALTPISITVIAAIVLKEKIDGMRIFCLALAIVGTCCVIKTDGGTGNLIGILLVVASLITQGASTVIVRSLSARYTAKQITTIAMLISLVFNIPTAAVSLAQMTEPIRMTVPAVLALLYMGVVGTALGQLYWGKSLALKEASFCSMFYPLQPVFSVLFGFFLLDEDLGLRFFIGLFFIGAGVVISCLHSRKQERKAH